MSKTHENQIYALTEQLKQREKLTKNLLEEKIHLQNKFNKQRIQQEHHGFGIQLDRLLAISLRMNEIEEKMNNKLNYE